MPNTKAKDIIRKIRELYRIGRDSLRERPPERRYRRGEIEEEAGNKYRIQPHLLRKARQLAGEKGYSNAELNQLYSLIRSEARRNNNRSSFTISQLNRLTSVTSKQTRNALLQRAITEAWSFDRLENEIRQIQARLRFGGRRLRATSGVSELLSQLEVMCEQWRRWHVDLTGKYSEEQEPQPVWTEVPKDLQGRVDTVCKSIAKLHDEVNAELDRLHPGRKRAGSPARE